MSAEAALVTHIARNYHTSLVYDFGLSVCNSHKVNDRCLYTKYIRDLNILFVGCDLRIQRQDRQAQSGVGENEKAENQMLP